MPATSAIPCATAQDCTFFLDQTLRFSRQGYCNAASLVTFWGSISPQQSIYSKQTEPALVQVRSAEALCFLCRYLLTFAPSYPAWCRLTDPCRSYKNTGAEGYDNEFSAAFAWAVGQNGPSAAYHRTHRMHPEAHRDRGVSASPRRCSSDRYGQKQNQNHQSIRYVP